MDGSGQLHVLAVLILMKEHRHPLDRRWICRFGSYEGFQISFPCWEWKSDSSRPSLPISVQISLIMRDKPILVIYNLAVISPVLFTIETKAYLRGF
jgi:hypothetical protein